MASHPSPGRCSRWRSTSLVLAFAFLGALVAVIATARPARADGAKKGGEVAGLLAAESTPMEAPKPRAKTTANAKPSHGHPGAHAKHHGAKHAKHGHAKHGNAVKPAKARPPKTPAKARPPKRGPKLRA